MECRIGDHYSQRVAGKQIGDQSGGVSLMKINFLRETITSGLRKRRDFGYGRFPAVFISLSARSAIRL